jgi:hypothetical protein
MAMSHSRWLGCFCSATSTFVWCKMLGVMLCTLPACADIAGCVLFMLLLLVELLCCKSSLRVCICVSIAHNHFCTLAVLLGNTVVLVWLCEMYNEETELQGL